MLGPWARYASLIMTLLPAGSAENFPILKPAPNIPAPKPERPRAMAGCVLSGRLHLAVGQRPAVRDEHRVVAEPPLPRGGQTTAPSTRPRKVAVCPSGQARHSALDEPGTAILAPAASARTRRIAAAKSFSGSCPARRIPCRRTAQGGHAEARIVSQRRQPGCRRRRQRLQPRVADEIGRRLLRLRQPKLAARDHGNPIRRQQIARSRRVCRDCAWRAPAGAARQFSRHTPRSSAAAAVRTTARCRSWPAPSAHRTAPRRTAPSPPSPGSPRSRRRPSGRSWQSASADESSA